jgi:hypothetical protein
MSVFHAKNGQKIAKNENLEKIIGKLKKNIENTVFRKRLFFRLFKRPPQKIKLEAAFFTGGL